MRPLWAIVLPALLAAAPARAETDAEYLDRILAPTDVERSIDRWVGVGVLGAGLAAGGYLTGFALVAVGSVGDGIEPIGGVLMGAAGVIGLSTAITGFHQSLRLKRHRSGKTLPGEPGPDLLQFQRYIDRTGMASIGAGAVVGGVAILLVPAVLLVATYGEGGSDAQEAMAGVMPVFGIAGGIDLAVGITLLAVGMTGADDVAWEVRDAPHAFAPLPWLDVRGRAGGIALVGWW